MEAINNVMRMGKSHFGKLEFLAKFQVMYNQTLIKSIIQLAFKRSRLIFYNSEVVFQQVHVLPSSTRVITPPLPNLTNEISSVCNTIFYHPHEIKNQVIRFINSISRDQRLVHQKFQLYLDRLIRSSVTNTLQYSIAENNLKIIDCKVIVYTVQKKLKCRVV